MKQEKKLRFFNRRKKNEKKEPEKLPLEVEIFKIFSENSNDELKKISFSSFQKQLESIDNGQILSLCNGTDDFSVSVFVPECQVRIFPREFNSKITSHSVIGSL